MLLSDCVVFTFFALIRSFRSVDVVCLVSSVSLFVWLFVLTACFFLCSLIFVLSSLCTGYRSWSSRCSGSGSGSRGGAVQRFCPRRAPFLIADNGELVSKYAVPTVYGVPILRASGLTLFALQSRFEDKAPGIKAVCAQIGTGVLLRGTIVNRTCGTHKNLYIYLYLLTIFGPPRVFNMVPRNINNLSHFGGAY